MRKQGEYTQIVAEGEEIFVFGSNKDGRHGKGAAKVAHKSYGAVYSEGEGLFGRSYAIPTKGYGMRVLPLRTIGRHIDTFRIFAKQRLDLIFKVTQIGCGKAGYVPEDIAPFFKGCTPNVILPPEFIDVLAIIDQGAIRDA